MKVPPKHSTQTDLAAQRRIDAHRPTVTDKFGITKSSEPTPPSSEHVRHRRAHRVSDAARDAAAGAGAAVGKKLGPVFPKPTDAPEHRFPPTKPVDRYGRRLTASDLKLLRIAIADLRAGHALDTYEQKILVRMGYKLPPSVTAGKAKSMSSPIPKASPTVHVGASAGGVSLAGDIDTRTVGRTIAVATAPARFAARVVGPTPVLDAVLATELHTAGSALHTIGSGLQAIGGWFD